MAIALIMLWILVACNLSVSVDALIRISVLRLMLLVSVLSLLSIVSASSFMALVINFSETRGEAATVLLIT